MRIGIAAALTLHRLEKGRVFLVGARHVRLGSFPVAPVGDVLEALVVATVLQVLGAQEADAAASIDDIVESDLARLARLLDAVGGVDGLSGVEVLGTLLDLLDAALELDRGDLDTVEALGTTQLGVVEHELVGLRSDDVPGVVFGAASSDEIGVFGVECQLNVLEKCSFTYSPHAFGGSA